MEAGQLRVGLAVLLPVDVVEEDPVRGALVLELEARTPGEGHGEPAVHGLAVLRAHLERQGHEVAAQTEAHAEEVAEGDLHAGARLGVPEDAQHRGAQVVGLLGQRHQGHPDVTHAAGAFDLAEHPGLAGRYGHEPRQLGQCTGSEVHGRPPWLRAMTRGCDTDAVAARGRRPALVLRGRSG